MKYFLIVVSLCLAVCQAYAQTEFHGVVAHRAGIWDDPELPENSIAALNKSAAIGVDVIEIDVHLSKDHIVVVNHDHDFKGMDIATHLSRAESTRTLIERRNTSDARRVYSSDTSARQPPALGGYKTIER